MEPRVLWRPPLIAADACPIPPAAIIEFVPAVSHVRGRSHGRVKRAPMSASEWRGLVTEVHAGAPWPEFDMVPWVEAQIHVESRGNPTAVSPAGAVGLMQIMPGTGLELGFDREQLLDPRLNIHAGLKYMRQMFDRLERHVPDQRERLLWAFAAYNGGILYARKAVELCGRDQIQLDSVLRYKPWTWAVGSKWYMHEQCCQVIGTVPERKVLRPRYQETWNYVSRIRCYRAGLDGSTSPATSTE